MNDQACDREREALAFAAANAGAMPPELAQHVASCIVCSETIAVASALHTLAGAPFDTPLPAAGTVWFRAQLQRRFDAERASTAPLDRVERIRTLVAVVACVILVVWQVVPRAQEFASLGMTSPDLMMLGASATAVALVAVGVLLSWNRLVTR